MMAVDASIVNCDCFKLLSVYNCLSVNASVVESSARFVFFQVLTLENGGGNRL